MIQALLLMGGVIAWLFLFFNGYVAPTRLMMLLTVVAAGVFVYEYNASLRRQSSKRSGRDTVALSAALILLDAMLATGVYHVWTLDWLSSLFAARIVLALSTILTLYVLFRYRRYMNHRNVSRQSGRKKDGYFKSSTITQRTLQQRQRQKETEQDGLASVVLGSEPKDQ